MKVLSGAHQPNEGTITLDGKVITSRGPGTALHFALRLVAELGDSDKATQLAAGMLVADP